MTGGTLSFDEFEQPKVVASIAEISRVLGSVRAATADSRHAGQINENNDYCFCQRISRLALPRR
jgi:hypothetical protein